MPAQALVPNIIKEACQALGELFIIGLNGFELETQTTQFISRAQIGGVILFTRNYENPGQLAELSNAIQGLRKSLPFWISTDHEGGKIQRFRKGFTPIPSAASVGAMNSPNLAFELGKLMAHELQAVGVNVNFCPVGDILTTPDAFIGNRAFGKTPERVSSLSTATIRGHLLNQVQPCIKHFPGHGDTQMDSHTHLPKVDIPIEILMERELQPFIKAIKSGCGMIMTAHILNSKIDPNFPATLSQITLQDILRTQLRYHKIIISDDLEMSAITDHYGFEEAPRLAIEAGCDLLIYRSEDQARLAYEALTLALQKGKLSPELVLTARNRLQAFKKEVLLPYSPCSITNLSEKLATPEHLALVQKVKKRPVS